MFGCPGWFKKKINSKQEALKTFRDLKDRTSWMAKLLVGSAQAGSRAGRGDEAKSYLDEGLSLFSNRKRHTRCLSDWSSDVCSSDLAGSGLHPRSATSILQIIARAPTIA